MDELRLAFFVDCAIIAIVKPLKIDTDTHTKSIFDKSILPMDTAFIIKRRGVDKLCACDSLTTFKIELPVAKTESNLHEPIKRMRMVKVLVTESGFQGICDFSVRRVSRFVGQVICDICRFRVCGVYATYGPFGLYQIVGVFIAESKSVKNIAFLPYEIGGSTVANFVF